MWFFIQYVMILFRFNLDADIENINLYYLYIIYNYLHNTYHYLITL